MSKKGGREIIGLVCSECKSQNYVTQRNKVNIQKKLEINKFCKRCRNIKLHKEVTKLK
ncbi:MAG: 50S ribosomal protein L33 [Patescibacteria group bacterium]|nr:50S ribosomal protein L33 [Patescibacteria group bacterium]